MGILYPKDATIHWSRCCSRRIRLHVILNGIVWRIRSLNPKRSQNLFEKECREKKRKQKRDTNTKLKTHLNVTPKTNEKKKNKLIRKKLQRENKNYQRNFCV